MIPTRSQSSLRRWRKVPEDHGGTATGARILVRTQDINTCALFYSDESQLSLSSPQLRRFTSRARCERNVMLLDYDSEAHSDTSKVV